MDDRRGPERFVGGKLIVFGGIPFQLCLGLVVGRRRRQRLGDVRYVTGRHRAPIFAGDTVFAATEIRAMRDFPGRPDLGLLDDRAARPQVRKRDGADEKIEIFYLERELAVKRRSHYA